VRGSKICVNGGCGAETSVTRPHSLEYAFPASWIRPLR
jgi:hypothetical protein